MSLQIGLQKEPQVHVMSRKDRGLERRGAGAQRASETWTESMRARVKINVKRPQVLLLFFKSKKHQKSIFKKKIF